MEKKNNQLKVQDSKTHYEIIKVTSSNDLLKAVPIVSHKDFVKAKNEIGYAVVSCADSLGLSLTDNQVVTLTEDIIDKYKSDCIEDIVYCLKKGRQGYYGTTYNKLNMIVISEWMGKHLEEKALLREKELSKFKLIGKEPINEIDYAAYKERKEKESESKQQKKNREVGYEKFYVNYMKERLGKDKKID